jgi:hypothetical protein
MEKILKMVYENSYKVVGVLVLIYILIHIIAWGLAILQPIIRI